jgi:hypothetical protein
LLIAPFGTRREGLLFLLMADDEEPPNDPADPLKPQPVDGLVVVKAPPVSAMKLTADSAEISGLRLLDAARSGFG